MTGLLRNNLYTVTQGFTGLFSDESSLLESNPQFFFITFMGPNFIDDDYLRV